MPGFVDLVFFLRFFFLKRIRNLKLQSCNGGDSNPLANRRGIVRRYVLLEFLGSGMSCTGIALGSDELQKAADQEALEET